MKDIIEKEAEEIFERMRENISNPSSYAYYQGKIDTLSWILKQFPNA